MSKGKQVFKIADATDIQAHLEGLNRLHRSWASTSQSERAKAIGMGNYATWFREHGMAIAQDPKDHIWKLNYIYPALPAQQADSAEQEPEPTNKKPGGSTIEDVNDE